MSRTVLRIRWWGHPMGKAWQLAVRYGRIGFRIPLDDHVDNLADRFTRALAAHRYGRPQALYYNAGNVTQTMRGHHNHLHITANRLATVQPQDMVLPTLAPAAAPKGVTQ